MNIEEKEDVNWISKAIIGGLINGLDDSELANTGEVLGRVKELSERQLNCIGWHFICRSLDLI